MGCITFKYLYEHIIHLSLQSLTGTNWQINQTEFSIKHAFIRVSIYLFEFRRGKQEQETLATIFPLV